MDYGIKIDPHGLSDSEKAGKILNVDYPCYFAEIKRLQHRYGNLITIRKGLEFGIQTHTVKQFQKLFDSYELDFVILSCHQVNNLELWTGDFQRGKTQREYHAQYYQEIYDVICRYFDYSVLGHLDLIRRYDSGEDDLFEDDREIITKILKKVIADGKGIEFNTSYHRYGLKDTQPSIDILKLYRELDGTIITIGSDSHRAEHLGEGIEEGKRILKDLGYEYFCTFKGMKPIWHKL